MPASGILFDFDGVVVKSMEQHFSAWKTAFAEKSITIRAEEFYVLEGQGIKTIAEKVSRAHGLSQEQMEQIMDRKVDLYNEIKNIQFYEYFHVMLQNLKDRNIPMGIVTGGNRDRVQQVVEEQFKGTFRCLVTVDDVQRGKPYPDPFLKGAELLQLPPEKCVVIENAPMGIRAAVDAGMHVIAITTTLDAEYLKQAHHIVDDFRQVEKVLLSLF